MEIGEVMELLIFIGKLLLTWLGRRRPAVRYPFQETEIVSPGSRLSVFLFWRATYLNLHPTQYAVAIAPDGQTTLLKGGYTYPLTPGNYTLHYVDKQNRVQVLPRVSDITRDGSQVSLQLSITYRVIDPIKALDVQEPVSTLLSFITSDVKEFIRSHEYDEFIGDKNGRTIDNGLIANYIKDHHADRHQMAKLFFIADIVVSEKQGDPKLAEIKGDFQVQQRQNFSTTEKLKQNQELEMKVAAQEADIKRIRAEADAKQQEIMQKMQMQNMELEQARADLRYRQEIMSKAMDAIGQALSSSTYPMDSRAVGLIKELVGELRGQVNSGTVATNQADGTAPTQRTASAERIGTLTDTLIKWLDYKQ
jgi:regulator of protease activity HflC (stomatin/prohibitin superfamily)